MWQRAVSIGCAAVAALILLSEAGADDSRSTFETWVARLRPRALAHGVAPATWTRVTEGLVPDVGVFDELRNQPEFTEQLWQYLNRRVSEWRIATGKEKLAEHAALLERIEGDFGVQRSVILGLWGIESAYGDPIVHRNHSRPVIPALARSPGARHAVASIGSASFSTR